MVGGGRPEAGRPHTKEDYHDFSAALTEPGRVTRALGIRMAYNPHLDCFIDTREHLDAVMERVDTNVVGLFIDPAHFQIKGSDPVDAVRTYIGHIDHMHFKDVQGDQDDVECIEGHARYRSSCEIGAGRVDFRGLTDVLLEAGYSGYVVVELDATRKTSLLRKAARRAPPLSETFSGSNWSRTRRTNSIGTSNMAEIIHDQVSKNFDDGTHAVNRLSLHVRDGEFMGLVGPPGCGKTPALRMLAGLEHMTEGRITIGNQAFNDVKAEERDLAMVFQKPCPVSALFRPKRYCFQLAYAKASQAGNS